MPAIYHYKFSLYTSDCLHCPEFYSALFASIRAVFPDCNESLYFGFDESKKRRQLLDYQNPQQLYDILQNQLNKKLAFKQAESAIEVEKENRARNNQVFPGDYFTRYWIPYVIADHKQDLMFFIQLMTSQDHFDENLVGMHLYKKNYNHQNGGLLLSKMFRQLTNRFVFDYGFLCESPEFDSLLMTETQQRVGPQTRFALNGLFWQTWFGPLICDHVGREQFDKIECYHKDSNQYGYLLQLGEHYSDWNLPEYQAAKQRIEKQLGLELFFNRHDPNRVYALPHFRKPFFS